MKKIFLPALFLLCLLTSCGQKVNDVASRASLAGGGIKRAVVLNSNCYKMIELLGVEDTVVGIADDMDDLVKRKIPIMGSWNKPNIERILEAAPDIVFAYKNYIPAESLRQLQSAGINVEYLEFFKPNSIPEEIKELGALYGRQAAAQKYIDFLDRYNALLSQRLKDIPENERRTVYYENNNGSSVSKGTGGDELITNAYCINIAGGENAMYPRLSDEWVLEQNPDVIVKIVYDEKVIKPVREALLKRAGWKDLKAVKEGNIILLPLSLSTSPDGFTSATISIAKAAYPELFHDIDPAEVYKETLTFWE